MLSMLPGLLLAATLGATVGTPALPSTHPTPSATMNKELAQDGIHESAVAPYPPAVKQALQKVRKSGGYTLVRANGKTYVVIGAGPKPTGGYRLVAEPVKKTAPHQYKLHVRLQAPAAGTMKTQVISYPTLVVAVPDQQANVDVQVR
ncbi:hypothetical protein T458_02615 [Brevibacillus panacihumi W25]|uniref:PrcB C-terminal domain-containing protein n=1 Tax=Brevibacillus panacihumi W25 TaxID=1408254 RepID=V6MDB3_9BACL|nr:protease complex subunit PrcB family protein [Brevibacillus panacihumi]EST56227.1 hypothetical protein T458_02615 [Brevibacillus panacihumi W25]